MLLDLGRNDVGRVAQYGTVEVTDSFFLEYLQPGDAHRLQCDRAASISRHDALEALVAGFPAGDGLRCAEGAGDGDHDELEKEKRGPYAGCIGYFGADGQMDTCIRPCAPPWSRTAGCMSRPAPASSMTATRFPSGSNASTSPRP